MLHIEIGYDMPMLGIGTWKSKEGEVFEAVVKALETGYKVRIVIV